MKLNKTSAQSVCSLTKTRQVAILYKFPFNLDIFFVLEMESDNNSNRQRPDADKTLTPHDQL